MKNIKSLDENSVAYCGVFCGGCPAYHANRCYGCRSEQKPQKRTSKWKCKKRVCCIKNRYQSCGECQNLNCKDRYTLVKNYRAKYSIDLDENVKIVAKLGIPKFIEIQKEKYTCKYCGGIVSPYDFHCLHCNLTNNG